jgi:outer membrane protein TolC
LAQTVFDAGATHFRVKQSLAAYDLNAANYRQTVLTAFQDVEDNLATLKLLEQESVAAANAATATEQTLTVTQNQYEAGTVNYLNVVVAQQSALNAERAVRDLANRRLSASVALLKALGGGWRAADLTH